MTICALNEMNLELIVVTANMKSVSGQNIIGVIEAGHLKSEKSIKILFNPESY